MTMDLGVNLAAPADYQPAQWADHMLSGNSRLRVVSGAATIGADGWPIGAGTVAFNCNYDASGPQPYKIIMLEGAAASIDVNQGAGNGGHVGAKFVDGVATITVKGQVDGSLPCGLTLTSPGRARWAVVRADEEAAYRADPLAFSASWLAKFKGFKQVRFMDWLMTNSNLGPGYVDTDPSRPAAFVAGVPLSVMVAFAKQTGIQPWFCIPVASTDDEVRSFARRIDECRTAGLNPTIELGNEVWNNAFAAHKYAVAQEQALWGNAEQSAYQQALAAWSATNVGTKPKQPPLSDGNRWYGYRATQVSKIFQSLGWRVRRDFQMAIGCFPNGWDRAPLVWAGVAAAGGVDADFSRWIFTFYTHGAVGGDFSKTVNFVKTQNYDGAIDEVLHGAVSSVDWLAKVNLPQHVAIAKAHNLEPAAYEGNMSFYVIPFFANSALLAANAGITQADVAAFFGKVVNHPRAGDVMKAVLDALQAAGVAVACVYADQGKGGENGWWGLYGTPGWDAMLAWISSHPPAAVNTDTLAAISADLAAVAARLSAFAAA